MSVLVSCFILIVFVPTLPFGEPSTHKFMIKLLNLRKENNINISRFVFFFAKIAQI